MKTLSNKNIFFILMLGVIFLPCSVLASTVYIETTRSDFFVGDTIMFNVRVDSEGKNINAVEGNILMDYLENSVALIDINTSDSKFSLWPSKPLPSLSGTNISFAGGSPGGFNSKDATVFNIALKLQKTGHLTLSPRNIGVYLNDGKGTKDEVSVKNLVINVLPQKPNTQSVDDLNNLISSDKTPPESFKIYLGQEGSVFDGKKFLSFNTTDRQSKIAYYEIIEGDLPPVRSSDTYILKEQNKPVKVTVIAYDSAGNARKSVYGQASYNFYYSVIIVFAILSLIIFKKIRKNKNEFVKK